MWLTVCGLLYAALRKVTVTVDIRQGGRETGGLAACVHAFQLVAKWLKHFTVDQKYLVRIPPVASLVKCFLHPSCPWETSLRLKGLGGKPSPLSAMIDYIATGTRSSD